MYIFFEKGMRGRVSYIPNRYKRHNFSLVACYSLQNSLVTRFRSCSLQKFTRYSLQNSPITRCRSCLLQKFTRYSLQNSLVTCCRSLSLQKFVRFKKSLVACCKFDRYLLHKFTKKSQLNLVMGDKI